MEVAVPPTIAVQDWIDVKYTLNLSRHSCSIGITQDIPTLTVGSGQIIY